MKIRQILSNNHRSSAEQRARERPCLPAGRREEASEGYLLLLAIISTNHTEAVAEDEEYDEEEMGRS